MPSNGCLKHNKKKLGSRYIHRFSLKYNRVDTGIYTFRVWNKPKFLSFLIDRLRSLIKKFVYKQILVIDLYNVTFLTVYKFQV